MTYAKQENKIRNKISKTKQATIRQQQQKHVGLKNKEYTHPLSHLSNVTKDGYNISNVAEQ